MVCITLKIEFYFFFIHFCCIRNACWEIHVVVLYTCIYIHGSCPLIVTIRQLLQYTKSHWPNGHVMLYPEKSFIFLLVTINCKYYLHIYYDCDAGFGQGLRRTVAGIASILGPLWTGSLLDNWYMMLGVMLGLNLLALVSYYCKNTMHST
mgnify:CR=1 FL=1